MPVVIGIIDWEAVGYLPRWMVATQPRLKRDFMVETTPHSWAGIDWQWMLSNACVRAGFPLEFEYAKELARIRLRHYSGIALEQNLGLQ